MKKSRLEMLAETGCYHKMWQGHNGEKVLQTNEQKHYYLTSLCKKKDEAIQQYVKWHSYCIMTNHPHETGCAGWNVTTSDCRRQGIEALGNWMRNAHSVYGTWYNKQNNRKGKVSCSRPKTIQIKSPADILNAMLYGDANPVRARMVTHPSKYKWSSYRFYAYGEENEFTPSLDLPDAYLALGNTPTERQRAYRSLMDKYLRSNGLLQDAPEEDVVDLSSYNSVFSSIYALIAQSESRARGRPC